NFIDDRIYTKQETDYLKEKYNIDDDERVLIHISNFRPVKRVPDVIRSFAKVAKQVKSKLLLIGDGPDKEMVEQLIKEFKLEDKVLLLGNQKSVAQFLSISDVFLLLSEKESFG